MNECAFLIPSKSGDLYSVIILVMIYIPPNFRNRLAIDVVVVVVGNNKNTITLASLNMHKDIIQANLKGTWLLTPFIDEFQKLRICIVVNYNCVSLICIILIFLGTCRSLNALRCTLGAVL